jgi:hypothetical protein
MECLGPVTHGKLRSAVGGTGVYDDDLFNDLIE